MKKSQELIEQEEWLILQVCLHIEDLMEEQNITKKELSQRLNKSEKYVEKIIDGKNLTLYEIANIMYILNSSLIVNTKKIGFHTNIKKKN